jgi:glucose/arabinose dehydrogenase/PKD repeat protein
MAAGVIKKVKNYTKSLPHKLFKTEVFKRGRFSKSSLTIFAVIFAVIGVYVLFRSFAAPPANFTNTSPITGLTEPTNMVFTPDGRMLILGRRGTIWVAQSGATQVDATPFLQLSAGQVAFDNERGLLGIALDPGFSSNGFYYIYYTEASTSKNRVSRFTAVGNTTNTNTETLVWRMPDVSNIYHQGGSMAFGPDGKLYVSVGDHLDSQKAQDLTSDKGKILRMNSDGTIPTDNPFYDGTGPNKDEIWAYGFRNPFRFSFDATTGKMYEGDVGEVSWEEVNIVTKGANYGWPTCEGTCSVSGMTNPTYTYDHTGGEASISGGFVYRGTQFPAAYRGAYFFGDYTHHYIRYLTLDANGNSTGVNFFDPTTSAFGTEANQGDPVAMAMGPDGSLYYVDIGPFQTTGTGKIHKLTYTAANQAPVVNSSANPTSATAAPLTVNFSSAGSSDPENQTLSYNWNFGDGTTSTQANPSHTYNSRGLYNVRLTVSDGTNSTIGNGIPITVGRAPTPTISTPANNLGFVAGQQINFSGSATDPEDGSLSPTSLSWTVVFHHEDHIHPGPGPFTGSSGSFTMPASGHDFTGNTSYEITLTATDADGISASTSVFINPQKVNLTFNTSPSGGDVIIDGISHTAPYTFDSLIGFSHTIDTPSPAIIGTGRYTFLSWSDGGAQSHNVIVPGTAASYTANYQVDTSLPAGLQAAYPFEEGNGGTSVDFTGHGNTATLNGALWWPGAKYGNGISFNGSTDFVSAADSNTLDIGNTGTIEAWVKATNLSKWESVIAKGNANDTNAHNYSMEITPANVVECGIGSGANGKTIDSSTSLTSGQFYHLACVWTGTTIQVYINGVAENSSSQTFAPAGNTSPLYIGQYGGGFDRFDGIIDEVHIYNRALSASEIGLDMNTAITQGQQDTTAPAVSITAPANSSSVRGASVAVSATASDNVGVAGVQFKLDGANLSTEDTSAPYSVVWNSTLATNGTHTLTAVARDAAGNTATSNSVIVTVDNAAPTVSITAPVNGSTVSGSSTSISANASDNVGVAGVQFYLDYAGNPASNKLGAEDTSSPYSTSWDTTTLANGSHTLTAIVRDAAGNTTTATTITVTVNNAAPGPDVTAPSTPTGLASPSKTSTSVNISWNAATDPTVGGATTSGLAGYKIYRNGSSTALGTTSLTNFTNSGLSANTTYTYQVTAYDNASNESAKSTIVSVTTDVGAAPKTGDLNNDNAVDIFDLSILLSNFGSTNATADINKDGVVNIFDLSILLSHYGS